MIAPIKDNKQLEVRVAKLEGRRYKNDKKQRKTIEKRIENILIHQIDGKVKVSEFKNLTAIKDYCIDVQCKT